MQRLRTYAAVALLAFSLVLSGCAGHRGGLSLWEDAAPAKTALVKFVSEATDPSSPGFIPEAERLAVFDLDGTLFLETDPSYFDWALFEHRVLDDKSYAPTAAQRSAALKARNEGRFPELNKAREDMVAQAYRGMTLSEFKDYVRDFMLEPQPGFTNLKRGQAFYRPMLEVVDMLVENGFTVYVVSGTERYTARALAQGSLNVPARQIIGSDGVVVSRGQGAKDALDYVFAASDELALGGKSLVKDLQTNKVTAISREIGLVPVLAFGNSMSDASMLNYALSNQKHKGLAFMLLCDDTEREYGKPDKAEKVRLESLKRGWIAVSMKNDWKTIYGQGVEKTRR